MTEYFNIIKPIDYSIVKTLILNTPEQCLNYNKIVNDLIQQGHQILPYVQSPNRIEISYIEKIKEDDTKNKYSYWRLCNDSFCELELCAFGTS